MSLGSDDNYKILISTDADTKGVKATEAALKDMGLASDKGGLSFGKMAGAVAAGQAIFSVATSAIKGITSFLADTVKSANDSEDAMSQLEAVIKSTGGAAGQSAKALSEAASEMQSYTTYSDEAIMGAENLLLTFTNVKKSIFADALPTILDMSTALGQDLKSSTIQVGKALNDPIKGITALSRVGVSFTQKQKDTIEALVKTGKTAEAQRIILKELHTEFGGSAKAAGETFAGSMERLKNQMDDVKESIGGAIVKGITPFIGKAAEFIASIDWEQKLKTVTGYVRGFWWALSGEGVTSDGLGGKIEAVGVKLRDFGLAAKEVAGKIEDYLRPKFVALWHTIKEDVVPQLEKLWHNVIEPLIPILGEVLVAGIGFAIDAFNFLLDAVTKTLNWMEGHTWVVGSLALAFGSLAAAMALGAAFDAIMVGFATLTLVTIPSLIATFSTVGTAFLAAFPFAVVIAGITGIIILIAKAFDAYKGLQAEQEKASKATENLNKQMDDQINKGKLTLDQAYKIQNAPGYSGDKTVYKQGNAYVPGYASGGYTGAGGENDIAGVVHKGEYVLPKSMVDQGTKRPKDMGIKSVVFNQTNNIFNQVDMDAANRTVGWRLANA